jgi:tyrosinase
MLDRVWYLWQEVNPSKRATEFAGRGFDDVPATLQDILPMMGLAPERKDEDFMTTMNVDLCYTY